MQQDGVEREERRVALLTWHEQVSVLRYAPVPDSVPGAEEAEWVREARVSDITARRCEPVDHEGAPSALSRQRQPNRPERVALDEEGDARPRSSELELQCRHAVDTCEPGGDRSAVGETHTQPASE